MSTVAKQPIYDPAKTFDDNFDNGPFGAFANDDRYENEGEPQETFLGYPVYLPFGIAAGSLPNSKFVRGAFNKGFDVVCYKTQRSTQFPVNEAPNVIPIDVDGDVTLEAAAKGLTMRDRFNEDPKKLTITNSFGNPSRGPDFWVKDLAKALESEGKGQLLIASVVGTIQDGFSSDDYYDDFAHAAKLAASTEVKAIELNLSCPNVANEGIVCYSPEAVIPIVKRTRAVIGNTKLLVKFGYFTDDQQQLLEDMVKEIESDIDAISVINTIPAAVYKKDGTQALPGDGRLKSGLCGAGIKWAGLDMVKRLNILRKSKNYSFEIIGVGGVMSPEDYFAYRELGADCVQSVTGAMWNPDLAAEVKVSVE